MTNKMISAKIKITSLFAILLAELLVGASKGFGQPQPEQQRLFPSYQAQQEALRHSLPGHYEFEVAPGMEPPSVRKPPYQLSAQLCPGTDPFAGFSPKDTLCGDLNQGRVPMNPLGQNILDQSYPFELIKNKTLQFLARALPVLKLEYETIPKVARFMQEPSNQQQHVLNPTHHESALSGEHFSQLNQRFAAFNGMSPEELQSIQAPYRLSGSMALRRRKRSARPPAALSGSLPVAELFSNASLVISSAHSGRILDPRNRYSLFAHSGQLGANSSEPSSLNLSPLGVITKDGYKSIPAAQSSQAPMAAAKAGKAGQREEASTEASGGNVVQPQQESAGSLGKLGQKQVSGGLESGNANKRQSFPATNNNHATPSKLPVVGAALEERNSGQEAPAPATSGNSLSSVVSAEALVQARSNGANSNQQSGHSSSPATANGAHAHREQKPDVLAKRTNSSPGTKLPCSEAGNGFTSAVCQAAAALIEGERAPSWLQLAKHIGNAYSANSDNLASSSNPIWSILASLAQESTPKSSGAASSLAQTKSNLFNLLAPISSLLTGGGSSSRSSSGASSKTEPSSAAKGDQLQAAESNRKEVGVSSLASSTITKLALAGWATSAIASLVEYFAPTVFGLGNNRSFARRKKPFDPQESFVDTPASIAAQAAKSANLVGLSRQPPTPCPSVEEYISPTFARNYQGAWKYVVQIPHEGYFTQTIQRTSCVRQKCDFTDGVCHESPRWVSLLVAEIYYPNTIYAGGSSVASSSQQQMATSGSSSSVQQLALSRQPQTQIQQQVPKPADPLQMTDSLATYNLNLNSAFVNAAQELGLDPTNVANMQQLANAYNYQLSQRYGNLNGLPAQQPAASESRVSHAYAPLTATSGQYSSPAVTGYHQSQAINYNDYITALATEALRQNPGMTINDLISTLQSQTSRKKRDLGAQQLRRNTGGQTGGGLTLAQQSNQPKSPEAIQSMNELGLGQMQGSLQQTGGPYKPDVQQASSPTPQMPSNSAGQPEASQANPSEPTDQMECDGHDKIGCYVVRVYYDWFLVNGSCKCWKTTTGSSPAQSSSGNSFLRRIFTG